MIIIGGHGKVALLAAPLLVADGHDVTSVVRNPDQVADVEATGATARRARRREQRRPSRSPTSCAAATSSCGRPEPAAAAPSGRMPSTATPRSARWTPPRRPASGATSWCPTSAPAPTTACPRTTRFHAYAEAKAAADEHLQGTDLAWTILRPSTLTTGAATGHIATGEGMVAGEVSRDNVAHVIRSVVEHPESTARRVLPFNDGFQPIDEVVATA